MTSSKVSAANLVFTSRDQEEIAAGIAMMKVSDAIKERMMSILTKENILSQTESEEVVKCIRCESGWDDDDGRDERKPFEDYWINDDDQSVVVSKSHDGKEVEVKLIKGSKGIGYNCFPFEQGSEYTLCELGYHRPSLKPLSCSNLSCRDQKIDHDILTTLKNSVGDTEWSYDCPWRDGMHLYLGVNNSGIIYAIMKGKEFVSAIIDNSFELQEGDGDTTFWLHKDGDLIVRNCGDVSSVVVISMYKSKVEAEEKKVIEINLICFDREKGQYMITDPEMKGIIITDIDNEKSTILGRSSDGTRGGKIVPLKESEVTEKMKTIYNFAEGAIEKEEVIEINLICFDSTKKQYMIIDPEMKGIIVTDIDNEKSTILGRSSDGTRGGKIVPLKESEVTEKMKTMSNFAEGAIEKKNKNHNEKSKVEDEITFLLPFDIEKGQYMITDPEMKGIIIDSEMKGIIIDSEMKGIIITDIHSKDRFTIDYPEMKGIIITYNCSETPTILGRSSDGTRGGKIVPLKENEVTEKMKTIYNFADGAIEKKEEAKTEKK